MTEILTESFCERCGTRYTFESAAPRKSRLARVRTVSRGLKNYVLQDESSFSEAMADARSEDERSATSHQLDAFHKTFNFCMNCRQYTCGNCWNTAEGRCLTCSPLPGSELVVPVVEAEAAPDGRHADVPWPEAALALSQAPAAPDASPAPDGSPALDGSPVPDAETWPEADLDADRLARALGLAAAGAAGGGDDTPRLADEDASALEALERTDDGQRLLGLAPGQSLDDALAAYEAQAAAEEGAVGAGMETAVEAAAEAEVMAPAEEPVEPEAALPGDAPAEAKVMAPAEAPVEPEPELVALAAAAAETVPGVPEDEIVPAPEPVSDAGPEPGDRIAAAAAASAVAASAAAASAEPAEPVLPPAPPRDDVVAQPTWPVAQPAEPAQPPAPPPAPEPASPATPAVPANPWLTVAPDDGSAAPEPQWPMAAQWGRNARTDVPTTLAGRQLLPRDDAAALWAASAAEVLSGGGNSVQPMAAPAPAAPQPCTSCGLSLSATARFCRRCGTRQG